MTKTKPPLPGRFVTDYEVVVLTVPSAGETASAADDLSGLWNLTAAAPRRVAGPSLQELDDAADEMAAVVAIQLGRVAGFAARNLGGVTVTASGGLWVFHLPGQHDQSSHGHGSYTETYGDVLDEASVGDGTTVVAVTETGDMHLAIDNVESGLANDREVIAELTPNTARTLADELRWAQDYDRNEGFEPNEQGIIDSTSVAGTPLEVWVYDVGDVGIRNVEEEGLPGMDLVNDEAGDLAGALDDLADFHEDQFGEETASALWTFQAGTPGPGTPRQAAISPDDLGVIRDAWTVVTDDVLAPKIAADYLAGAKGQHDRLAAALPPKVRGLAGRPLLDAPALLHAAGAANRLKSIGDELWQAARTALLEGMARGESITKLARRVRDATGVSLGRATTIARTESMAARSAGSYEEMLASGVVVSKTWQATGDLRTRPTHVVADGQTVPMAAKFTVGGWPADRPHDSLLPPEESVNCRCTLTYGVDTDVATAVNASGADDDGEIASGLWDFSS